MKRIAFLAIIAVLATQGVTQAQEPNQGRGKGAAHIFEKLDADGDGGITLEEMRDHARKRREAIDLNNDGRITPEEIVQFRKQRRAERFAHIDVNSDGVLSRDEVPERFKRRFDRVDANGDGKISQEEMLDGEQAGRHGERRGKDRRPGGEKGGPIDPEARLQKRFERMDADNDGVVTLEELQQGKGKVCRGRHGKKGARK